MAKRGVKPKKAKGEMVWIPDYLVSVVKKIKEIDMTALKETFARSNTAEIITIESINDQGVKLLDDVFVYREHLCIPTTLPEKSLFGVKIFTVIDREEIEDLDDCTFPPQTSLEDVSAIAKQVIDSFFERLDTAKRVLDRLPKTSENKDFPPLDDRGDIGFETRLMEEVNFLSSNKISLQAVLVYFQSLGQLNDLLASDTEYLLSNASNASHLGRSIQSAKIGRLVEKDLIEE